MDKLAQYQGVFNHFDENGDGRISPSELRQCVAAIGGELPEDEAKAAVEFLDADGDGLVGLDDFVRFVEGGKEEEKLNDLREAGGFGSAFSCPTPHCRGQNIALPHAPQSGTKFAPSPRPTDQQSSTEELRSMIKNFKKL